GGKFLRYFTALYLLPSGGHIMSETLRLIEVRNGSPMKQAFVTLFSLLVMLGILAPISFGQIPEPSVYIEPDGRFGTCLATAMDKRKVPASLVTNRTQAAYVLRASRIKTSTVARYSFIDGAIDGGEITIADMAVDLSESASRVVVWSDVLSEPTEGRKT